MEGISDLNLLLALDLPLEKALGACWVGRVFQEGWAVGNGLPLPTHLGRGGSQGADGPSRWEAAPTMHIELWINMTQWDLLGTHSASGVHPASPLASTRLNSFLWRLSLLWQVSSLRPREGQNLAQGHREMVWHLGQGAFLVHSAYLELSL